MAKKSTIAEDNVKPFYYSRNLPHMFEKDKPIFITYRLRFTLPRKVVEELRLKKEKWQNDFNLLDAAEQSDAIMHRDGLFFAWFDELIAKSEDTPNYLLQDEIRAIISESFHYYDSKRYELLAYCIMSNHVHVLIFPLIQASGTIYPYSRIMYTWKRYTSNAINKVLNRSGSIWRYIGYDRMVRDEDELNNVINYIVMNPVKARLVDDWRMWKGTYIKPEFIERIM